MSYSNNFIKHFLILSVVGFLSAAGIAFAQEEALPQEQESIIQKAEQAIALDEDISAEDLGVSEPRILPDSPFYFVKTWWRGAQSFLTFDPIKKVELKLKFANEKLIEAKKVILKENVSSEKIAMVLDNYQKGVETVRNEVEKRNLEQNPKVEKFLNILTDRNIKQQKLLDRIEKQVSLDLSQKVRDIQEKSLDVFADISLKVSSPEKLGERMEEIVKTQQGSPLKHIKNLEVLMKVEEKVPEQAKEAIRTAQANTLKRLSDDLDAIPDEEKPILEQYLKNVGGNAVRHLEIISGVESNEISSELKRVIIESKERVIERIENKLKELTDGSKREVYLKHLESGDIGKLRVIKELQENLSPGVMGDIISIKQKAQERFRENLEGIETPDQEEKFLRQIETVPGTEATEILKEIEDTLPAQGREMLESARERISARTRENLEMKPVSEESVLVEPISEPVLEEPIPNETDEYCSAAAGESMALSEAKKIAINSECAEQGALKNKYFCNSNTGTWWIDLDIEKQGCSPACVINVITKKASINWRCTGLLMEP